MTGVLFLEIFKTIAACLAAVAAVVGVYKYRSEVNTARKLKWQKTTVQGILQHVTDRIDFDSLKTKYKSSAADRMNTILKLKDISDEALRSILIDLCSDNVIVQLGGDTYSLTTYPGQIEKAQGQNAEMLGLQKTFFEAQLIFMGKQDAAIGEMIAQQKRITAVVAPDPVRHSNIRELK